jgi:hypothetical protein
VADQWELPVDDFDGGIPKPVEAAFLLREAYLGIAGITGTHQLT